jgi:transmembrane sensor
VAEGSIDLTTLSSRQSLDQGWRARVGRNDGAFARNRVTTAAIGAWRHGRMIVDDWTMAEAVAELGRYHRGLIWVVEPELAAARLSGVFDLGDPERALVATAAPHGGRVRRLTGLLLVVARA